jgi:hypothetical protein
MEHLLANIPIGDKCSGCRAYTKFGHGLEDTGICSMAMIEDPEQDMLITHDDKMVVCREITEQHGGKIVVIGN